MRSRMHASHRMNKYLKIALVAILLACLGLFIYATDWAAVMDAIRQVGFNFLILILITGLSAWMAVLGWRYCLPREAGVVSDWQLFWIRQIGENVAILNPASIIGGEASKMYLLRDRGIQQKPALHSILLSRGMMIVSQMFWLLVSVAFFLVFYMPAFSWPQTKWYSVGLVAAGIMGVLVLLRSRLFRQAGKSIFHRLGLLNQLRKARRALAELWQELLLFYRENRRAMFLSFLFCSLHWIVGALEFYYILYFLGIQSTVAKALLVDMGVIVFKSAGVFVPGQLGVEEYGNKVMLAIIGISGSTIWITASILKRARQLAWIVLGLLAYVVLFRGRQVRLQEES